MRRSRGRDRKRARSNAGPRLRWKRWLIATLVAPPLAFGTGYAVAAYVIFPAVAEEPTGLVAVPRLHGSTREEAERELTGLGLAIESVVEYPHQTARAGTVIAQSPLPGQRLQPGAAVRLAVSSGRPQLQVPDLVGLPYETAARVAEQLGFTVNRRDEAAPGTTGLVFRSEPAPGTQRELPAAITLFVVAAPDAAAPELTAPGAVPDSTVAERL